MDIVTDYNYNYDSDISPSPRISPAKTAALSCIGCSDSDSLFCVSSVNSTNSSFFYLSPSADERDDIHSRFFPEYGQPRVIVTIEVVPSVEEKKKNLFRRLISGIVSGIHFDKCFKRYN